MEEGTCHHSLAVLQCRTATLSQKYIWQERARQGEGKMERRGRERGEGKRERTAEGCSDGVESVV